MRSIRLSLIVYFLALLAVGLGAVCGLFYFTTAQTLKAKELSTRQLHQREFESRREEAMADLDKRLLQQARMLAGRTRASSVFYEPLFILGSISSPSLPQGHLLQPLWAAEGASPLTWELYRKRSHTIFLVSRPESREEHPYQEDPPEPRYFQLFHSNGKVMQISETLNNAPFALDDEIRKSELFTDRVDTVVVDGKTLRRLTFKGAVAKSRFGSFPAGFWGFVPGKGKGAKGKPKEERPPIFESPAPTFYLMCAADLDETEAQIAAAARDLDENVATLERETDRGLANLRHRLIWIGVATFAGLALGGFGLLCLGLRPLRKLSDAVSQVSEKDFRLRMDGHVPVELCPIVERLKETLAQLRRAFDREKQASADISHELRTPLAALMTNLEVALRKSRTEQEYREILNECRSSGQQMYHLVERLLALARLDAGAVQLKLQEEVDVGRLAAQCANLVKPLAENRGLTLRVQADEAVTLRADPDKVREVLTNLLHNAIEYNRPQGSIDVAVARNNGHVELTVSDTGIGISAEAKEHIFERFFRADPSRQADTPHAGLGLSIVKSYVDLMGGSIRVESGEAGTTFKVALPAKA